MVVCDSLVCFKGRWWCQLKQQVLLSFMTLNSSPYSICEGLNNINHILLKKDRSVKLHELQKKSSYVQKDEYLFSIWSHSQLSFCISSVDLSEMISGLISQGTPLPPHHFWYISSYCTSYNSSRNLKAWREEIQTWSHCAPKSAGEEMSHKGPMVYKDADELPVNAACFLPCTFMEWFATGANENTGGFT